MNEKRRTVKSGTKTRKRYTICCFNVPKALITNKSVVQEHFEQFGRVLRVIIRVKSNSCNVDYDSFEAAQNALVNAGLFENMYFDVSLKKEPEKKTRRKLVPSDPTWPADEEIQAELNAMGTIDTYSLSKRVLRPKKMETDELETIEFLPQNHKPRIKPDHIVESKTMKKISTVKSSRKMVTVDPAQVTELLTIINQPAETVDEKYRVLEARDKLIRLHLNRQADIATATKTVGTCPDMCPEKERLMRESQHQVAIYEQVTNARGEICLNHQIAIKQYSRSSADQETPLPHDLRPVPVLQLTMSYLLHSIMNLCESADVNVAEWYHFVWDRTRGIRKDITQQDLCCFGSVELVEQCARFHIHCSGNLAGEDASVFDEKINTENLTKCLQTLKYMYHDLGLSEKYCPNEAEFRGYIILLNLHDGNFMWEVKQLRQQIQTSLQIKFAIKVYSALDTNNFVKFFKLVRSTSYLNACILLRYFNQVRSWTIHRMIRTHSPRATEVALSELKQSLAFEDIDATISFVVFHGLSLNEAKTHVILDRTAFINPAVPYGTERAVNVVESKRTLSVGEVISGKALPPKWFENHIPHSSFSSKGVLNSSEIDEAWRKNMNVLDRSKKIEVPFLEPVNKHQLNENIPDKAVAVKKAIFTTKTKEFLMKSTDTVDSKIPLDIGQSNASFPRPQQKSIFDLDKHSANEVVKTTINTTNIFSNQNIVTSLSQKLPPQSNFSAKTNQKVAAASFVFQPMNPNPTVSINQAKNIFSHAITQSVAKTCDNSQSINVFGTDRRGLNTQFISKPSSSFGACITENSTHLFPQQLKIAPPTGPDLNELAKQAAQEEKLRYEADLRLKAKLLVEEAEKKRTIEAQRQRAEYEKHQKILEETRQREARAEEELRAKIIREMELKRKRQELLKREEEERYSTVESVLNNILDAVIKMETQRKLHKISSNIKNWKLRQLLEIWRNKVRIKNKKRKAISDSPIWVPHRTYLEEAAELFMPNQALVLQNMKRYKLGHIQKVYVIDDRELPKIQLSGAIYKSLKHISEVSQKRIVNTINWKVYFTIPDKSESNVHAEKIENVLKSSMPENANQTAEYLLVGTFRPNSSDTLNVCFQYSQGPHIDVTNEKLDLFFWGINDSATINVLKKRWQSALTAVGLSGSLSPFILLVKGINPLTEDAIVENLNLRQLVDNHIISNYKIAFENNGSSNNLICAIDNGLTWLARNTTAVPPIKMNEFSTELHECLGLSFLERIDFNVNSNVGFKFALSQANTAISLYNEAILRLSKICLNEDNIKFPDFPSELKQYITFTSFPCTYEYFPDYWKHESYRNKLQTAFNQLLLPKFTDTWPPKNVIELEEIIERYCDQIVDENFASTVFLKILCFVLNFIENSDDDFSEQMTHFPWMHVLETLVMHKVNVLEHSSKFANEIVVYNGSDMTQFKRIPWWFEYICVNAGTMPVVPNEPLHENKVSQHRLVVDDRDYNIHQSDIDDKLAELLTMDNTVEGAQLDKQHDDVLKLNSMLDELTETIELQKQTIRKFDEILEHAIVN